LKDRLLLPTDKGYEPQIQSWWAQNSRLHPWCLILPQNTAEVALALTTLLEAGQGAGDWNIALRSGGHSSIPGSNNVANGVTIDLSMINTTRYDKGTNTAILEPGARWEHVYADLQDQGVTVAGGRDGGVGVGGFLLGGGLSFFTPKIGFGCDSVVNYEVVLTNGSVINANKTANSDLWRALKGGGSNFGVVTRYDLEAIPTRKLLRDLRFLPLNYSNAVVDTVVDFANHDEALGDNALVTFLTHDTSISNDSTIGIIYVNTAGDANAGTSFDKLKGIPALVNVTTMQTMSEAAAASKLAAGSW
jgi:FAD/FMN-containing dehydrogenase